LRKFWFSAVVKNGRFGQNDVSLLKLREPPEVRTKENQLPSLGGSKKSKVKEQKYKLKFKSVKHFFENFLLLSCNFEF